ncbi:MAG: phage tail assembly protein [Dehalococcoidia bacterium]|nr:phage tail assembly protein [Dehalococcoidia bacterium]
MNLQTEFDFTLPRGYVDRNGTVHRKGRMRLATAVDEIAPLRDPRVRQNQAYHTIILLARVITHLGTMPAIDTAVIEGLYTADLAFLQELYRTKNELVSPVDGEVRCPSCGEVFVPLSEVEEVEAPVPLV